MTDVAVKNNGAKQLFIIALFISIMFCIFNHNFEFGNDAGMLPDPPQIWKCSCCGQEFVASLSHVEAYGCPNPKCKDKDCTFDLAD